MKNNEMIRCPHCGALVHREPEDDEQYCQVCHKIFKHVDAEPVEPTAADPLGVRGGGA